MTFGAPARWLAVASAALVAGGCGGGSKASEGAANTAAVVTIPARKPTAAEPVLALAPLGAIAVLEIDLLRLRSNPVVGELVTLATTGAQPAAGTDSGSDSDSDSDSDSGSGSGSGSDAGSDGTAPPPPSLLGADLLVFVSYDLGLRETRQLLFAVGDRAAALPDAHRLDDRTAVFGPPDLVAQVEQVRRGQAPSLSTDRGFLRARAMAMPARAEGASIRLAADLDFNGRVALAGRLDLDVVPAWISMWLDVADDLAAVVLLGTDADAARDDLVAQIKRLRHRASKTPLLIRLGLAKLVRQTEVQVADGDVRAVLVLGPKRLTTLVERMMRKLGTQ